MIMAPVSLPACNSARRSQQDPEVALANAKKRNSVHFLEDASSTLSKRISLYSGVRSRSFSESWVFMVPEIPDGGNSSTLLSNSSSGATIVDSPAIARSSSLKPSRADTTPAHPAPINHDDNATATKEPDHALMASLASFLERGCPHDQALDNDEVDNQLQQQQQQKQQALASASAHKEEPQTAGPTEEQEETDLVITVRDFAYPAGHPYHYGKYPPPPVYEESDVEEDETYEEEEDDQDQGQYEYSSSSSPHVHTEGKDEDRTSGQSRGLYDFDAENASELSFREGDILWIHCRQFPGWFLGEMGGVVGLVPENYVQML